ncbi:MAG: sporulation protein YqfD [Limnochordales bacterium]|nr:sporulation protein YqfD [Limnochordales bacterium]
MEGGIDLAAGTFWRQLDGYAIIKVHSNRPEGLLNALLARRREVWHVERVSPDLLLMRTSLADVPIVRALADELGVSIVVLKEGGLPFLFRRWASRVLFALGAVLSLLLLVWLTRYIWFIEVQGVGRGVEGQIRAALTDLGVSPGVLRRRLDADRLAEQLLLRVPRLAWVGVSTRGTYLQVRAQERVVPETLGYGPADLIARKDGLVLELVTLRGSSRVQKGQLVSRGEVLIAGVEDGQAVRAEGLVRGRVWYEGRAEVLLREERRQRTGRIEERLGVCVGDVRLILPFLGRGSRGGGERSDPDLAWEEEARVVPWRWGGLRLPLAGLVVTRYEVKREVVTRTEEQARQEALQEAWNRARQKLPPGVVVLSAHEEAERKEEGGNPRIIARVLITTFEDLGGYRLRPDTAAGGGDTRL